MTTQTRYWSRLLLCAALASGACAPSHAFWSLFGKVASKGASAGKVAGAAGKSAAAGAAVAEGATLAEGAAHVAGKSAHLADDAAHMGTHAAPGASVVNAALPPEVAVYLAKPAQSLSAADTAHMMSEYRKMVAQASRSGDFTGVERAGAIGAGRKLDGAAVPATSARPTPAAAKPDNGSSALPWHAFRLLSHAAIAGNREAQNELDRLCRSETRSVSQKPRAQQAFGAACQQRSTAATKPSTRG